MLKKNSGVFRDELLNILLLSSKLSGKMSNKNKCNNRLYLYNCLLN